MQHLPALSSWTSETEMEVDMIRCLPLVEKLLLPHQELLRNWDFKIPLPGSTFHFGTMLKQGSVMKSCLSAKKKLQLGGAVRGGSWSFAFLKKLRQCCSFRGNYANSSAYKLVFVHENCLEFVASHIFPSQAESFLFLLLASFSDSLREDSLWWCFTVLLVSTAGPDLLSQPCLGVYATIDLLNLIVMLHFFATFKHCCTVSYPAMRPHPPLQSLSAALLRKLCSQVKLLSTPKKPICLTWTGCKQSFVAVFSLWEKSQVEKALLKIWQRGKVDVNRIWKQELFQREACLERKKNFSSTLVLEGLK